MPKTKTVLNYSQEDFLKKYNEDINKLTKGLDDNKYFVFFKDFFEDYYKIFNCVSNIQSVIQYNPSPETNKFIEIITSSETKSVIKIPIIKTNVKINYISILKHVFVFSESNGILVISFNDQEDTMMIRSSYKSKKKTRLTYINNNNFFSLGNKKIDNSYNSDDDENNSDNESSQDEEEDYTVNLKNEKDIPVNINDIINFDSVSEEIIKCNNNDEALIKIKIDVIKSVIYYTNVNFDYFKNFFKKLDTLVNVTIKDGELIFKSYVSKSNKEVSMSFTTINVDPDYKDKEINFIINSKSITKLKSLNKKYHLVPETKMFEKIEIKIVADKDKDNTIYGLTIFPGNLNIQDQDKLLTELSFDIYNSVMIFIPQNY